MSLVPIDIRTKLKPGFDRQRLQAAHPSITIYKFPSFTKVCVHPLFIGATGDFLQSYPVFQSSMAITRHGPPSGLSFNLRGRITTKTRS
jgi:hypothetical protein